jgi:hypothetical protein
MNQQLKDDIEKETKTLKNPTVQKQFKDYYYDKAKVKNPEPKIASTSGSRM